jgi:putative glutamine amidotransferase
MKQKPIIGISPCLDQGLKMPLSPETIYLRSSYTKILESVGAIPIILNQNMPLDFILNFCDGIVISGGEDINPDIYGGKKLLLPEEPLVRTLWELKLIEAADRQHLPILGICYGMQLLAIHFGGAIHQDIPTEIPEEIGHLRTLHRVELLEDFLGLPKGSHEIVESRHHQAVAQIPENFTVSAIAPDGVIEAMQGRGHYGMQWHPESDETGIHVYRSFVERCA